MSLTSKKKLNNKKTKHLLHLLPAGGESVETAKAVNFLACRWRT